MNHTKVHSVWCISQDDGQPRRLTGVLASALVCVPMIIDLASAGMPSAPVDVTGPLDLSTLRTSSVHDLLDADHLEVFLAGRQKGFQGVDLAGDCREPDPASAGAIWDSMSEFPRLDLEIDGPDIGEERGPESEPDLDLQAYIGFLNGHGTMPPSTGTATDAGAQIQRDHFPGTVHDLPLTEQRHPRRRTAARPQTPWLSAQDSSFDLTQVLNQAAFQDNASHDASFANLRAHVRAHVRAQARADREPGRSWVMWSDPDGDGAMEMTMVNPMVESEALEPGGSLSIIELNGPPQNRKGKPHYPGLGPRTENLTSSHCVIPRSRAIHRRR